MRLFNLLLNQANSGGKYSPSEVMLLINRAQFELFGFYTGHPEMYQPGFPIAPQAQAISQRVDTALRPFYKPYVMSFTDGVGTIPSDYVIVDNARNSLFWNPATCEDDPTIKTVKVTFARNYEMADILDSPIDFPTIEYPYAEFGEGLFQLLIYPRTISRIQFNYLRRPATFYWNHNPLLVYPVWIPGGTDQPLEWPELEQNKIIARALVLASVGIREDKAFAMVENLKQSGI